MRHCLPILLLLLLFALPVAAAAGTQPQKRWLAPAFSLHVGPAVRMSGETFVDALAASAAAWNQLGAGPEIGLQSGLADNYPAFDGVNGVFFVARDWPAAPEELALTYAHVDSRTREILEVDIAVNASHHFFTADGDDDAYDLQNVLTHELGHALGLAHNEDDADATMYPLIRVGEQHKRDPARSDEQALLALYEDLPAVGPTYGCSSTTAHAPSLLILTLPLLVLPRFRKVCP